MSNENTINAVALKLPPFWSNLPAAWFINIESQFNTRGIVSEQTKYDYVVQSLPMEIVSSVFDILSNNQSSDTPYTDLKKALIDRNTMSESKRIEQLLSGEEMGDRRPSEFYRRLRTLAGESALINDKLIIELWTRRLPSMVQALVKASDKTETSDLLNVADKVFETCQQQSFGINSIAGSSNSDKAIYELTLQNQKLQSEISEIKEILSKLNFSQDRSRPRSNSRYRHRSKSRSDNRSKDSDVCFYHRKFGNKAHKCTKPCSFSSDPN